jgi:hypothetical protein
MGLKKNLSKEVEPLTDRCESDRRVTATIRQIAGIVQNWPPVQTVNPKWFRRKLQMPADSI